MNQLINPKVSIVLYSNFWVYDLNNYSDEITSIHLLNPAMIQHYAK